MACGVFTGVILINAVIAGLALTYLNIYYDEAKTNTVALIAAGCANVAFAPILLVSLCFIKGGRDSGVVFAATVIFALWGSATVGVYELASDLLWLEDSNFNVGERVALTIIPTVFLILFGALSCCCCDCCCCPGDGYEELESGPNFASRRFPGRKFRERWTRRTYDSL